MKIKKSCCVSKYVSIDESLFDDNRLSWDAKGIYSYICSRDNPEEALMRLNHGENKYFINELIENGYLEK